MRQHWYFLCKNVASSPVIFSTRGPVLSQKHSALEVKCMMPPGENVSVPVQLIWGGYLSPPYYMSYRPPYRQPSLSLPCSFR